MHWAAYKGFKRIVWYLLRANMSALDIDMHGNTSVHQAAAAGDKCIMECFLSQGIDIELKNA
jgi:ankyrin repeat protein